MSEYFHLFIDSRDGFQVRRVSMAEKVSFGMNDGDFKWKAFDTMFDLNYIADKVEESYKYAILFIIFHVQVYPSTLLP